VWNARARCASDECVLAARTACGARRSGRVLHVAARHASARRGHHQGHQCRARARSARAPGARSARANATAAAVDETYFEATGTSDLYSAMYYSHILQFEAAAAMFAGNFGESRHAERRTVALTDPIADQMVMLEPFAAMELFVLVRFERWADVLGSPVPKPSRSLQLVLYHWACGGALAGTGRATDASAALLASNEAMSGIPADAMVGPANTARAVAAVVPADLRGRIADAKGDAGGAIAAFTDAVAAEDRPGYNEPPD